MNSFQMDKKNSNKNNSNEYEKKKKIVNLKVGEEKKPSRFFNPQ